MLREVQQAGGESYSIDFVARTRRAGWGEWRFVGDGRHIDGRGGGIDGGDSIRTVHEGNDGIVGVLLCVRGDGAVGVGVGRDGPVHQGFQSLPSCLHGGDLNFERWGVRRWVEVGSRGRRGSYKKWRWGGGGGRSIRPHPRRASCEIGTHPPRAALLCLVVVVAIRSHSGSDEVPFRVGVDHRARVQSSKDASIARRGGRGRVQRGAGREHVKDPVHWRAGKSRVSSALHWAYTTGRKRRSGTHRMLGPLVR